MFPHGFSQCLAAWRIKSRLMNAKCLLIITIPKNVQPNSVPKLVMTGNVPHHDGVMCVLWFLPERDVDA